MSVKRIQTNGISSKVNLDSNAMQKIYDNSKLNTNLSRKNFISFNHDEEISKLVLIANFAMHCLLRIRFIVNLSNIF